MVSLLATLEPVVMTCSYAVLWFTTDFIFPLRTMKALVWRDGLPPMAIKLHVYLAPMPMSPVGMEALLLDLQVVSTCGFPDV
jgi:hypothetical protein